MRPKFPLRVTVRTPGAVTVDPDSGNEVTGPSSEVVTRAYLAQQSVAVLSASDEIAVRQNTTISTYTLLVPPTVPLTSASVVIDEQNVAYRIAGQPAERRGIGRRVIFKAAAMHRISDLQA